MTWQPEVDELRRREGFAKKMGGEASVDRHHSKGKLTVRERIDKLLDEGTFHENGALGGKAEYDEDGQLTEFLPANYVFGTGRIQGRKTVVGGDDFTVRGGAADASITEKIIYAERMAHDLRIPIVRLVDGTGGGGSVKHLEDLGHTYIPVNPAWNYITDNLSCVPVVAACMGSVAGYGAAKVVASHFSIMVNEGCLFTAGPPVVKSGIGEDITKEELGGVKVHKSSGAIDNIASSEEDAFLQIRKFLSYLPQNVWQLPPVQSSNDDPNRRDEQLISVIPRNRRKVYSSRSILKMIFDIDSVFEIGRYFGGGCITAFARLDGYPVGVLASDPYVMGGAMTSESAEKMWRFVDLCQTFHLPIANLIDQPGIAIGLGAEKKGTIRKAARAICAIYQTTVPTLEIIMRKVFGVGGAGSVPAHSINLRYAWPSGDWGSLPTEGGIQAAYRRDIESSDDPERRLKEITNKLESIRSPFRTAEVYGVEEIIDPRDTRPLMCDWIHDAYEILPSQLGRSFHGMRP